MLMLLSRDFQQISDNIILQIWVPPNLVNKYIKKSWNKYYFEYLIMMSSFFDFLKYQISFDQKEMY